MNDSGMGSLRIYDSNVASYDQAGNAYLGAQVEVINWGKGAPDAGFTVLNTSNQVLLNIVFPSGRPSYRTEMVPLTALSLSELRDSAGTSFPG
jgi:hypothetical protein